MNLLQMRFVFLMHTSAMNLSRREYHAKVLVIMANMHAAYSEF